MGGTYRWQKKPYGPGSSAPREPAGVCDNCGRFSWTLIEVGITCFFCFEGEFTPVQYWRIEWCPVCRAADYCEHCHCTGIVAWPLDEPGSYIS